MARNSRSERRELIPNGRRYWAVCANPDIYRIEEAVRELDTDTWTTRDRPIKPGDRIIIWKSKGHKNRNARRGVVGLGEILSEPQLLSDADNPYWTPGNHPDTIEPRVVVRYVSPPGLPLWESKDQGDVLKELSVSRATGGTIFNVTEEQWNKLLQAIGGWPTEADEIQDVRQILEEKAGKRRSGQGFQIDPKVRRAIENYAMELAQAHYLDQGWDVQNVSTSHSYDLVCTRQPGEELRVEVKGTTSDGSTILLTPNEVKHACAHFPQVALFIVANIHVAAVADKLVQLSGGEVRIFEPWKIDTEYLTPLAFKYEVHDAPNGIYNRTEQ